MKNKMRNKAIDIFLRAKVFLGNYNFFNLQRFVIELNNVEELKKVFNWKEDPILDSDHVYAFKHVEDINERRRRDAESLAVVMRNVNPKIALEIGTADGFGTFLMSINSPESKIYTVNIPPEEITSGKGGRFTTFALEKEKIGKIFREKKVKNIEQIYANTATWKPKIGKIDVAFIDGCHDTKFVYNDTLKILRKMKPGSFIVWHDFNLGLTRKFYWIYCVCRAIEKLYNGGYLKGQMFHIKDSWVGIYQVK